MIYRINPDYGHVSAVVLEGRHLVVRSLDFCGELRWEQRSTTDLTFSEGIDWARRQLAVAATYLDTPCCAATISVAAPVDLKTGGVPPVGGGRFGGYVPA